MPTPIPPTNKLLERMRAGQNGWSIRDVETVCRREGIACDPPRGGGSHYKVTHPGMRPILTIPSRRPIKPHYIQELIAFIDDVRKL